MPGAHKVDVKFPQCFQFGILGGVVGNQVFAYEFGAQEHDLGGFFFACVIAAIFPNSLCVFRCARSRADQTREESILCGQIALYCADDIGVAAVTIDEYNAVYIFRAAHCHEVF